MDTRQLVSGVLESPIGRITLAGYIRDSIGTSFSRRRVFGNYAVVYLLDGSGRYVDDRQECRIGPGDLIVVFPDIGHAYGPGPGEHWDEIFIAFGGPVFDLWRKGGLLRPQQPVLHLEPLEYWRPKWEAVVQNPGDQGNPPPLTAVGRLLETLAEAVDATRWDQLGAPDRRWLDRAKALLEPSGAAGASLEEVAEELGMSYVAFRKRFTRLASMPPGHFRVRRIIDRACMLIYADPTLGNKELARHCAFANEYHFSRRFKQVTGLSPKQFRSQVAIPAAKA